MKHLFIVIGLVSVLCIGCSKNASMSGKVTFADDDSPLRVGIVCFTNGQQFSQGIIQSDGTYVVGTESETDGIPPGKYQVYVSGAAKELEKAPGQFMSEYEPLIAPKYARAATSGLSFEVNQGKNIFDFKVERSNPAAK